MPDRILSAHTTPRRSPRFHHQKKTTSEPQQSKTLRTPLHPNSFNSSNKPLNPSPTSIQNVSMPQRHKVFTKKSTKNSTESKNNSTSCIDRSTGLRRSSRLNNGVNGFQCLRRSPRSSNQQVFADENKDLPSNGIKKLTNSDKCSSDLQNLTPKPRESTRLNGPVQSLRRSQRLLNGQHTDREESLKCTNSDSDFSVDESDVVVARKAKVDDNLLDKSLCSSDKGTGKVSVGHAELLVEGREGKGKIENRSEIEDNRKRKRGENGEEIVERWTKEQEVALQNAYFSAKPTPHFWKKVSKLVPGKSAQDCFDRIHGDHSTPPQRQPRSRAETIKSSPVEQFTLSASKLLEPLDKKVRRSYFFKQKNYLTQKSVQKRLQPHRKVDHDHEGDLFSVFEPNMDFSTNTFQPSDTLSTPMQQNKKQGFVQSCSETSSLSHMKSLSKSSSWRITDLVSPPVLKQVKNRVLHERYVNQLRCRDARRRAASARIEMSITGKTIGDESSFQKRDVLKAAKSALVSEARDAISKFQRSQANFMGIVCRSDEDNDDGIGVESVDKELEDESQ